MSNTPDSGARTRRVVILGGGTAGWMAAAALTSMLPPHRVSVTLVESEAIGIIGVGEATLPHLRQFNETIGLAEDDFIRETRATYKLGIEFVNWGAPGERYIHPFGAYGNETDGIPFHQFWLASRPEAPISDLEACSLPIQACRANRFARPQSDRPGLADSYGYAYQFDSTLYAPLLRRHAEARGAIRIEGRALGADQDAVTGNITAIRLAGGKSIEGDFFIDCSGFKGLLIEDTLASGYEDWSKWLPCDRAIAAPTALTGPRPPYTRATAGDAGWQWRIPLQHRMGNGHVYASEFLSDDTAGEAFLAALDSAPLAEPRRLFFKTGKRKSIWSHNCISAGLASGFLEPLESTSIHLTQLAITHFLELFPLDDDCAVERTAYNALMDREFERVRDFLILHYVATRREDSEFWRHMRAMDIPDSLAEKRALFEATGRVATYQQGLFLEPSWVAVYLGQGVRPRALDPRLSRYDNARLNTSIDKLQGQIRDLVAQHPDHDHLFDTGMMA